MKNEAGTSPFDVPARRNHNTSKFYQSNLYKDIKPTNEDDNTKNSIDTPLLFGNLFECFPLQQSGETISLSI